jgi:hypothetical protein
MAPVGGEDTAGSVSRFERLGLECSVPFGMLVYCQTLHEGHLSAPRGLQNTYGITLPGNDEWPLEMDREDLVYECLQK